MRKYEFYGWQQANVPAAADEYKQIKNPKQLYDILSEIWCADTCAPRMRADWTKENRTLGQCSVSAFLAQDIFGGEVYGIHRADGNYHCYNVVGDCVFDLTSEQFGDEALSYEDNPVQSREVHFAKEEKRLRYEYLKEELRKKLKRRDKAMLSKEYTQSFKDEKRPRKKLIQAILFILFFTLFSTLHITATTYASSKATEITISAAGDCTLGVDYHYNNAFNDCYKAKGSSYFLKNVKNIFSKDDITITNLEGPLTTSGSRVPSKFTFKGSPKYTSILTKGSVEVVNLANNHTRDYGASGLSDTKKALKKSKISYCQTSTIAYKKVKGVKVAFLGFNQLSGVSKKQVKDGIGKAKKAKAKIIVVSFHWGVERTYEPNSMQTSMGRYAIRCGASLVLGHHPHVLQGIEKYKGRYIVYSLGNFCYGGHTCPADKDTMIFQQTFTVKDGKLKKDDDAKVIPCSISSVKSYNNFQPTPLSGSRKRTLIKKINRISKGKHVTVKSNGRIR